MPRAGANQNPRHAARWVITGQLVLTTPARFGGMDDGIGVDMPLLRDPTDGSPLLTGSSLAGALRSALVDRLCGYGKQEDDTRIARLFGHLQGAEEGEQSSLIVFDSHGSVPDGMGVEIRDGVALDPATGTAQDHAKYDLEILPPGTRFPLRFELLVPAAESESELLRILAGTLAVLDKGELALGARRSRGFGRCRSVRWQAKRFALTEPEGWYAWLATPHIWDSPSDEDGALSAAEAIRHVWGEDLPELEDHRRRAVVELQLENQGGFLVRSPGARSTDADAVHLHSGGRPTLPGTSLTGALRAQALRIARLLRPQDAEQWVDRLFGRRASSGEESPLYLSRLQVVEAYLEEGFSLRPGRIRVDRFTGGAMNHYLFEEQPYYRGHVQVRLEIREPQPGELGLLLLLLKDLLTSHLPVGGAVGAGRGRFAGRAVLNLPDEEPLTFDPHHPPAEKQRRLLDELVREFQSAPAPSEQEAVTT